MSLADGSLGRGTNRTILKNLSTTVSITELPSETGSAEMKSKEMWDQGRPGAGFSRPRGEPRDALC